jgi:hypothetical protein
MPLRYNYTLQTETEYNAEHCYAVLFMVGVTNAECHYQAFYAVRLGKVR